MERPPGSRRAETAANVSAFREKPNKYREHVAPPRKAGASVPGWGRERPAMWVIHWERLQPPEDVVEFSCLLPLPLVQACCLASAIRRTGLPGASLFTSTPPSSTP